MPPYNVELLYFGQYWESHHVTDDLLEACYVASGFCGWDEYKEDKVRIIDQNNNVL